MMRPSTGRINIAATAQKLDVDNRISLRYYYRISDNILRQADIFREEKNIIDLYVMLLRFSSLISETIPRHRDYKASYSISFKKKLLRALGELEELKPAVQQKLEELNRKYPKECINNNHHHGSSLGSSVEWPPPKKQARNSFRPANSLQPVHQDYMYNVLKAPEFSYAKPFEDRLRQLSLVPCPTEETLSRHSILGPNGLYGQWQPPSSDKRVQYPSNIDLTPVEILSEISIPKPAGKGVINGDRGSAEHEISNTDSTQTNCDSHIPSTEEPDSLISFEPIENPVQTEIIRQPSPPPVLADVQDLIPTTGSSITDAELVVENPSSDGLVCSDSPLELHISTSLMKSFMKLAKSNTDKNLETCGVLAGSLKNRKFYITALIIPKQESTSDSCQTTNEEEIFEVQDKQSLFPLGWIHTHPTQSCFMSSIDVHTHYSYQIMLPEAIAIVMAPRDTSRTYGIFRLTNPGGMTVIRQCPRRGFHAHDPPPDGGPIYKQCTDVYMNPDLNFDVIDLR